MVDLKICGTGSFVILQWKFLIPDYFMQARRSRELQNFWEHLWLYVSSFKIKCVHLSNNTSKIYAAKYSKFKICQNDVVLGICSFLKLRKFKFINKFFVYCLSKHIFWKIIFGQFLFIHNVPHSLSGSELFTVKTPNVKLNLNWHWGSGLLTPNFQ